MKVLSKWETFSLLCGHYHLIFLLLISQHAELSAFGVECFPLWSLRPYSFHCPARPTYPLLAQRAITGKYRVSTWERATDGGLFAVWSQTLLGWCPCSVQTHYAFASFGVLGTD